MLTKLLFNEGFAARIGAGPRSTVDQSTSMAAVLTPSGQLSHRAADELCNRIQSGRPSRVVVVDMKGIEDATTAAFARLVLLRRELLRHGRDLRLKGLRSRAASVWRVSRLSSILPLL